MGKYISLFNKKYNEFVRVFLFGEISKIDHFKTGILISSRCFNTNDKIGCESNELLKLLVGLNLPIELVIFHRTMACKLFSGKISNSKELDSIAAHTLNSNHCNTTFYYKISRLYVHPNVHNPKMHTYELCTCDISDDFTKLLLTNPYNLKIISMSVFPLWVTSAFCNQYRNNNITSPVLFNVEYLGYWHIILMSNGCVVYNRSVLIDKNNDMLRKREVTNTIKHIENNMNINIEDLIIYEFENNVIDAISSYSIVRMKIASNMEKISNVGTVSNKIKSKYKNNNSIARIACLGISGIVLSDILTNVYKTNKIAIENNNVEDNIESINGELVENINVWEELSSKKILNQPNYKEAIQHYMQNRKEKLIKITMYWDKSCEDIICDNVQLDG